MPRTPETDEQSGPLLLGLVLGSALLFGFAAVLLSGSSAPAAIPLVVTSPSVAVTSTELGIAVGVVLFVATGYLVARRLTSSVSLPLRMVLSGVSLLLAGLLAYILLRVVTPSTPSLQRVPQNVTTNGTGTAPPSFHNVTAPLAGAPLSGPAWAPYAFLALLLGIVASAAWAIARWRLRGVEDEEPTPSPSPDPRSAITRAIAALDRAPSEDPRAAIVAAYAQLLAALGPRAGPIEPRTAREIEETLVGRGQLSRGNAHLLTGLFEAARYSTLPMGPEELAQAHRALSASLAELNAAGGPR
jgi:hypothetical protein